MKYSNDNAAQFGVLKYIKDFGLKSISCILIAFLVLSCTAMSQGLTKRTTDNLANVAEVPLPGAYQLDQYLPLLEGKRVAVVGNQTSVINQTHLVDSLLSLNIRVVKVFSPEHGFRGTGDAGAKISDAVDTKTKLPIISLYGDNKKPKVEQLKNIDILLFDLQDVGVRFYTYISTLHYVMEAAAENNIEVIVLDRPNPNIHIIDGPTKKPGFESFVSMHPVPVYYGMTIGEYGLMINGEKWLKDSIQCKLNVVANAHYDRNTPYSLPIAPSPNLKNDNAINLYPSLCLFEGTIVSVGRGTDYPFEVFGHPDFPKSDFTFTPLPKTGASDPLLKNVVCNGVDLRNTAQPLAQFNLSYLLYARDALVPKYDRKWINSPRFFNLLAGNAELLKQLENNASEAEIRASWQEDLKRFKEKRVPYLIY